MSRKEKTKMARKDAMRSHPAGKKCNDNLDFAPLIAGMDASHEGLGRDAWDMLLCFDMSAIDRKPVVDLYGGGVR